MNATMQTVDVSLLERAQSGDDVAFAELTGPRMAELRLHCYRMLGSLVDAEDAVQDTMLAAWRGLSGYSRQASLRTWLYRIATNCCLNAIRDGKRHQASEPVMPFAAPQPTRQGHHPWLQPLPDTWLEHVVDPAPGPAARYEAREAVHLTFIVALQQLPPRQIAALLLRDVLGFSTAEVAETLDTTVMAVKGVLQRARSTLRADRPQVPSTTNPAAAGADEWELANRFSTAFTDGDVDALVALLSDAAWLAMPPAPHEYEGTAAIGAFLAASFAWRNGRVSRLVPVVANAQPAFAAYLTEPGGRKARATGIFAVSVEAGRVHRLIRFQDASLVDHFALPRALDGRAESAALLPRLDSNQ
jgi:RNA polymerase sigma-70 factor (TIGR02960 family)